MPGRKFVLPSTGVKDDRIGAKWVYLKTFCETFQVAMTVGWALMVAVILEFTHRIP